MKKRLALILAIIMALVIAMPVMAGQRETSAAEPRGYSADGHINAGVKSSDFTVDVHDPALEIDVWGQLWFNAADKYYIANTEDDTFTMGVAVPEGVSLDRCYIQTAYDWWQPVFFTDLPYENGYYIYSGPIDSIYTTGYNFTDVQIYVDQEYNPDEHYPTMIINVYATPDDADSFCSEFEGSGWEYIDDPGDPTPTPEQPTPTPEQPTPTPEQPTPTPEQPTPTPGQPTPTPEDPPKAGGPSLIIVGALTVAGGGIGLIVRRRSSIKRR